MKLSLHQDNEHFGAEVKDTSTIIIISVWETTLCIWGCNVLIYSTTTCKQGHIMKFNHSNQGCKHWSYISILWTKLFTCSRIWDDNINLLRHCVFFYNLIPQSMIPDNYATSNVNYLSWQPQYRLKQARKTPPPTPIFTRTWDKPPQAEGLYQPFTCYIYISFERLG